MAISARASTSAPGTATLPGIRAGRRAVLSLAFGDVGLPSDTALVAGKTTSGDPPTQYSDFSDFQSILMTGADAFQDKVNGGGNYDGSLTWDLGLISTGWTAGAKVYVALFDSSTPGPTMPPLVVPPAITVQA